MTGDRRTVDYSQEIETAERADGSLDLRVLEFREDGASRVVVHLDRETGATLRDILNLWLDRPDTRTP